MSAPRCWVATSRHALSEVMVAQDRSIRFPPTLLHKAGDASKLIENESSMRQAALTMSAELSNFRP
jgi:hypothetical protein